MKRHHFYTFPILFLLLLPATGLAAKKNAPATSPFDLFNHDTHHTYFTKLSTDCALCHKDDNSYTRETVNKGGCHHCHNNAKSPAAKAQRFKCVTCHKDLKAIEPTDHNLNWTTRHQVSAKQNKQGCLKCHQGYFCTECHQRRDFTNNKMHGRLYKYSHSIDARSNPKACSSCHQLNFCKDCHARP